MAEPIDIIKRPLITEKSTWESQRIIKKGRRSGEAVNRYSFKVAMPARKPQIKAAIEHLYGVRVEKVSTQIRKGVSDCVSCFSDVESCPTNFPKILRLFGGTCGAVEKALLDSVP